MPAPLRVTFIGGAAGAWFEYAPADAGAFETLLHRLRETDEWSYVEREVDVRLVRI